MTRWQRFLDWLLGARCHACGRRVFPRDIVRHYRTDCAGRIA